MPKFVVKTRETWLVICEYIVNADDVEDAKMIIDEFGAELIEWDPIDETIDEILEVVEN